MMNWQSKLNSSLLTKLVRTLRTKNWKLLIINTGKQNKNALLQVRFFFKSNFCKKKLKP